MMRAHSQIAPEKAAFTLVEALIALLVIAALVAVVGYQVRAHHRRSFVQMAAASPGEVFRAECRLSREAYTAGEAIHATLTISNPTPYALPVSWTAPSALSLLQYSSIKYADTGRPDRKAAMRTASGLGIASLQRVRVVDSSSPVNREHSGGGAYRCMVTLPPGGHVTFEADLGIAAATGYGFSRAYPELLNPGETYAIKLNAVRALGKALATGKQTRPQTAVQESLALVSNPISYRLLEQE